MLELPNEPVRIGVLDGLATLSDSALLDSVAMGRIFGRHPKNIALAVCRGELPPPMVLLGKKHWTAGAIRAHLANRQAQAIRTSERRDKNRA